MSPAHIVFACVRLQAMGKHAARTFSHNAPLGSHPRTMCAEVADHAAKVRYAGRGGLEPATSQAPLTRTPRLAKPQGPIRGGSSSEGSYLTSVQLDQGPARTVRLRTHVDDNQIKATRQRHVLKCVHNVPRHTSFRILVCQREQVAQTRCGPVSGDELAIAQRNTDEPLGTIMPVCRSAIAVPSLRCLDVSVS